jgi:hypothetical protein
MAMDSWHWRAALRARTRRRRGRRHGGGRDRRWRSARRRHGPELHRWTGHRDQRPNDGRRRSADGRPRRRRRRRRPIGYSLLAGEDLVTGDRHRSRAVVVGQHLTGGPVPTTATGGHRHDQQCWQHRPGHLGDSHCFSSPGYPVTGYATKGPEQRCQQDTPSTPRAANRQHLIAQRPGRHRGRPSGPLGCPPKISLSDPAAIFLMLGAAPVAFFSNIAHSGCRCDAGGVGGILC